MKFSRWFDQGGRLDNKVGSSVLCTCTQPRSIMITKSQAVLFRNAHKIFHLTFHKLIFPTIINL